MEGEKATAVDVDSDLTPAAPNGRNRRLVRRKGGPLLLKELTEEHCYTCLYTGLPGRHTATPDTNRHSWQLGGVTSHTVELSNSCLCSGAYFSPSCRCRWSHYTAFRV